MSVTQKEIAERVGVSQSLVARVLKGYPHISENTQEKVLAAAQEMGYSIHSNGEARLLAARRHKTNSFTSDNRDRYSQGVTVRAPEATGFIGLVGAAFSRHERASSYWMDLADGIQEVVEREERRVLLLDTNGTFGWDNVDGVLILNRHLENFAEWIPQSIDCISLLHMLPGCTNVVADDYVAGQQAAQHLLDLGHRRIAFMLETRTLIPQLRLNGYRDALQEAGVQIEDRWLRSSERSPDPDGYVRWGQSVMDEWLREDWKQLGCTALIAQNDGAAAGALLALREACWEVPRQVSVVGFDGTPIFDHFSPQLTSVEIPLREIGVTAAEILLKRIWNRHNKILAEDDADVVLSTKMKIRQSTSRCGR